ncbi:pyridoxamine 5'-phosphate oxidase family protein [Tsukamurella sp. PLM1]|uniref:pyridoxamine 5'-phosphate oxidase family protein n=1 Tax=Tsukamurella sp. PLM1 TaxID=2929795 RepID=UPI002070B628|nr:pyridoxamine 5'-phosphate oxidase family protein [Tsukamurella sp. PLM1]BDH58201.1 pyridoxamine 5'-phosphate oxidase [Tsukamurella sp. PLM1]
MATQYDHITEKLQAFIAEQHMYFVATAAPAGRVNVSPKGLDSLRVLGPNRVLWLNGTGSGNETAAHLLRSPRITLMFCSFEHKPLILRLYGTARAVHAGDPEWPEMLSRFPTVRGSRNLFDVTVDLVQTSCGFGVPLYEFGGQRTLMDSWAANKGDEGLAEYQRAKNVESIDGFPTGLPVT